MNTLNTVPDFTKTFVPKNFLNIEHQNNIENAFNKLHELSVLHSQADPNFRITGPKQHITYAHCMSSEQVAFAKQVTLEKPGFGWNDDIKKVAQSVLTPEIDQAIKNYFGSYYTIMFYAPRTLTYESGSQNPSTKWHCDASPTHSLMLMCYLNGESEHGSSTLFLPESTTKVLKDVGYIYNEVGDRRTDISDILDHYQLDARVERHGFNAGESILFAATELAHRAQAPQPGCTRTSFDMCIIPSPVPWDKAIEMGYTPANKPLSFKGQALRLLAETGIEQTNGPDSGVIRIEENGGIVSDESLLFHLRSIFKEERFAQKIYDDLHKNPIRYSVLTIGELIVLLKKSFKEGLNWGQGFNLTDISRLTDVIDYEKAFLDSLLKFSTEGKPNPDAIMWPIPNHEQHPRCKYDMVPFVQPHKIMNKSTPIGSAGSCFAVEIADVLQEEGFNYVVTELGDNPQEEAIIDGYTVGSGKAMYSANFGILFNTPSLRQLAEKAFGERTFTKYLVSANNGLYMDPYRENVYFKDEASFLRDYPKHIEAVRQALVQSDVFIFTAGLNECWQLQDGTVISRNPRRGLHHLIEHRTLTVQENVDNILAFFHAVKRHNPNFKLILTLSPVPLLATGRADDHHIIEANTHSKAVLRVALDEVVKAHPDIYYLPSYELVTECTEQPWEPDHRHVTRDTVKRVVDMFKQMFVA